MTLNFRSFRQKIKFYETFEYVYLSQIITKLESIFMTHKKTCLGRASGGGGDGLQGRASGGGGGGLLGGRWWWW